MASTYIYRNNDATAGGGYSSTWTWSAWVKRGTLGEQGLFMNRRIDHVSNSRMRFQFSSSDNLFIETKDSTSGDDNYMETKMKFRDVNAWYHIVLAFDTTQSNETDRIKIWINNKSIEGDLGGWNSPNRAGSTFGMLFSSATRSMLGIATNNSNTDFMFDGSMSHVHFIYGTAYTPSAFGETDATTGEWKIKTSPSVTYGSQGFFVLKDGNSATDQSGQSNNMTIDGGTLTKTEDCPSNVFATLNPLVISELASLSKGNNTITGTSASNNSHSPATLQVGTSGKYYYEVKVTANESGGSEYSADGIVPNAEAIQQGTGAAGFFPKLYFDCQGKVERSSLGTGLADLTGLTSVGSTGIKMFAIDMDNGAIYIGANGVWLNNGSAVGVPTSGGSKTGAMWSFTPSDYPNIAICSSAYNGSVTNYNFGNGYFGTTAVSSAGTNASGNGIFEYDVPTGYTALSTKGLNT